MVSQSHFITDTATVDQIQNVYWSDTLEHLLSVQAWFSMQWPIVNAHAKLFIGPPMGSQHNIHMATTLNGGNDMNQCTQGPT